MTISRTARHIGLGLMLAASVVPARAADDESYQDIVVQGMKDPFRITPRQLHEAVQAYQANRAALAPNAPLRFQVFRYRLDPSLADIRLRLLADNGDAIPLPLDSEGRFALPPLDFEKKLYALQANRKVGTVRVRPLVLSPDSTDENRSMGETRLLCKVGWALARDTVSILARGIVGAAGGLCESSKIGAYYLTERPLASAKVRIGPIEKPVQLGFDGGAFRMPGYDKSLPNDARLILVYK